MDNQVAANSWTVRLREIPTREVSGVETVWYVLFLPASSFGTVFDC